MGVVGLDRLCVKNTDECVFFRVGADGVAVDDGGDGEMTSTEEESEDDVREGRMHRPRQQAAGGAAQRQAGKQAGRRVGRLQALQGGP